MCFCAYYYSIILASNMYSECVSVHRIARGTNCVLENEFYGNFYHRFTFLNHVIISYKNWLVFYIEHYEKKVLCPLGTKTDTYNFFYNVNHYRLT